MKIKELKKENKELQSKLYIKYGAVFDKICDYLDLDNEVDENNIIIKNDILTMLYDGQERGEEPESIIGKDYKVFADEIYKEKRVMSNKLLFFNVLSVTLAYPFYYTSFKNV